MTNSLILTSACDKVVIEMKWGITVNDIQIKCFLAAAQSRSFSEAAEKVYMTPPTFGRYISSFETVSPGVEKFAVDRCRRDHV
jgi:DNA-binding MarR family transcriptional regulator